MNEAIISFNSRSNKWEATFNGKVLASSPNKNYIVGNITSGKCTKANAAGVTTVREVGQVTINAETGKVENVERFNINERFDFLKDFVEMVADRTSPSLVITGEGGLGKTHTVNKALKKSGMKNIGDLVAFDPDATISPAISKTLYAVIKGYSTAKGLYRTLYENRNRICIFDDCDSILKDDVATNVLKAALDSYDRRIISWNAEASFGDDLPRSFEFTGGIVFISNMPINKIDGAIRSRSICVDVSMTTDQKLERMSKIIEDEEFMPDYEYDSKVEALNFITRMKNQTKELSLRTLISTVKVAGRGDNWERRAEYLLTAV